MLVLSRHKDEVIVVTLPDGRIIKFVIVDIRGDKVRVGVEAPKEIGVNRKEVYDAITREMSHGEPNKDCPGCGEKVFFTAVDMAVHGARSKACHKCGSSVFFDRKG